MTRPNNRKMLRKQAKHRTPPDRKLVAVQWFRDGELVHTGPVYTATEADVGCSIEQRGVYE
jgi:hypothetical protein